MTFQPGNQLAKGNQFAKNSTNQRRDTTIELIAQLNEETTRIGGKKNTKLQRMIANLIAKATDAFDVFSGSIVLPQPKSLIAQSWRRKIDTPPQGAASGPRRRRPTQKRDEIAAATSHAKGGQVRLLPTIARLLTAARESCH
jgi:hypothetical protein